MVVTLRDPCLFENLLKNLSDVNTGRSHRNHAQAHRLGKCLVARWPHVGENNLLTKTDTHIAWFRKNRSGQSLLTTYASQAERLSRRISWFAFVNVEIILTSFVLRKELRDSGRQAFLGVISILFGAAIAYYWWVGVVTIAWLICTAAIATGLILLWLGFKLRIVSNRIADAV